LPPLAWYHERNCHAVVLDHFSANLFGGALSHAKNVVDVCLLKRIDVGCADHATISYHADFVDGEILAQTLNNRRKPRHVGGVARPQEGRERALGAIEHDTKHHLFEMGPIVLGVAESTQLLPARALEIE
jgi:hypothetical protein